MNADASQPERRVREPEVLLDEREDARDDLPIDVVEQVDREENSQRVPCATR